MLLVMINMGKCVRYCDSPLRALLCLFEEQVLEEVCFKAEQEVFHRVLGTFEPVRKELVRRMEDDALLLPLGLGRHICRAPGELF